MKGNNKVNFDSVLFHLFRISFTVNMTTPHRQIWHQSSSVISEVDHRDLAIIGEYLEGPPQLLKHKRVER